MVKGGLYAIFVKPVDLDDIGRMCYCLLMTVMHKDMKEVGWIISCPSAE